MRLFGRATDLDRDESAIRRRAYGVIEVAAGDFQQIRFRLWPKISSLLEVVTWGARYHDRATGDRCWLYYNQPCRHRRFLSLPYIVSTSDASFRTVRCVFDILDRIALIKKSDAIICHVGNDRVSHRLLERLGYQRHLHDSSQRHYIRRFNLKDAADKREHWRARILENAS